MARAARKPIPNATELSVLDLSRRRCALCYRQNGDLAEKRGQLAHLDGNPANFADDNLAFLCLDHHSLYDSRTSQHKNYTVAEVKAARAALYEAIQDNLHITGSAAGSASVTRRQTDRKALDELIEIMSSTMHFVRNMGFVGTSFTWLQLVCFDRVRDGHGAEHEFIDPDLEALRKKFVKAGDALLSAVASNTRRLPYNEDYRAIPTEWERKEPERYARAVTKLQTATRRACAAYDELVRLGRARLLP